MTASQYILAVEVVLDPAQDSATVHAAYTSADIATTLVETVLTELEDVALRMAEASKWDLSLSPSAALSASSDMRPPGVAEEAEDLTNVDQEVVSRFCSIAAQFLRIDSSLVTADTSLLSLGLDSIKSVGLARKLSADNLPLTSADIMRLSTPLRLAAYIQRSASATHREDRLLESAFVAECEKLTEALDIGAIKLAADDDVKVFPTSVLQAGMLSQV